MDNVSYDHGMIFLLDLFFSGNDVAQVPAQNIANVVTNASPILTTIASG